MRPLIAEGLGTFWIILVVGGVSALVHGLQLAPLMTGAAAGVAYMTAALAFGRISVGHFNPIFTLGLRAAGGFGGSLTFSVLAQLAGAILAVFLLNGYDMLEPPVPVQVENGLASGLRLALLIGILSLIHVAALQMRPSYSHLASGGALALVMVVVPGGSHALINAAHGTADTLLGTGTALPLLWLWVVTIFGAALGGVLWRGLRPEWSDA